jgi:hypothetical protein
MVCHKKNETQNIIRKLYLNIFSPDGSFNNHLLLIIRYFKNIHIIVGQILPLGISAYLLAKIFKFKYSIILHGLDFSLAIKKPRLTQKILSKAEKIICANGFTSSQVAKFNRELQNKIHTVNPGIESVFVRNPQKVKELEKNIIFR